MSIGTQPKITSAAELDYAMAQKAAERIVRICQDAAYTAPEATGMHLAKVAEICLCIDAIADGLRLIKKS